MIKLAFKLLIVLFLSRSDLTSPLTTRHRSLKSMVWTPRQVTGLTSMPKMLKEEVRRLLCIKVL